MTVHSAAFEAEQPARAIATAVALRATDQIAFKLDFRRRGARPRALTEV